MEEKQYPLIGPATYEEAISRIEAAEKEIEEGKGSPWDAVMQEARHIRVRTLCDMSLIAFSRELFG